MRLFNMKSLSQNLDMAKFRKELEKSIGGQDGLKKEHLLLTDAELIKSYLIVYDDFDSIIPFLKPEGVDYYLKIVANGFGAELKDNSREAKILLGLEAEHTDRGELI